MKRALVTGGSGAIGGAICQALAEAGYDVLVHANRNRERAAAVAEQLRAQGHHASPCSFDVRDGAQCAASLEQLLQAGPIQVLVNNAGLHDDAPLAGMKLEQWRTVVDVNLNGFFHVTQPLLLPMMGTRWGRIISISSVAAVMGNRGQANYAAAKAGIHAASKSLAIELASRGVTVNVVAPGIIDTAMSEGAFSREQIKAMVPMQRAGTTQEVAALVAFLASDQAGYISGQVIGVNGAMA